MNGNVYSNPYVTAAEAGPIERSQFIRRTYLHLAGAILAFTALEAVFLNSAIAPTMKSSGEVVAPAGFEPVFQP